MKIYNAKISFQLVREDPAPSALSDPKLICSYMASAFEEDPTVEWLYVVLMDRKNRPLGRVMVTKGTANSSLVHPREVFRPAVLASASAIVLVHNHPSGDPTPSYADVQVTRDLKKAADIMKIELLDSIIIGERDCDPNGAGYYSFRESGGVL